MAAYRCLRKGNDILVFDRAGVPSFKKADNTREVIDYSTNTLIKLPADHELMCTDINARPSICVQFGPQECNAFSDLCQGYNSRSSGRKCRRRGTVFSKSLSALEKCYRERDDLLDEIQGLRSKIQGCDVASVSMDRDLSAAAANQAVIEQLREQLQNAETELLDVQRQKVQILEQAAAERETALTQAKAMNEHERSSLLATLKTDIGLLQGLLDQEKTGKAASDEQWRGQLAQLMAAKNSEQDAIRAELTAVQTEKKNLEQQMTARQAQLVELKNAEIQALQATLRETEQAVRDVQARVATNSSTSAEQKASIERMAAEQQMLQERLTAVEQEKSNVEVTLRAQHAAVLQAKTEEFEALNQRLQTLSAEKSQIADALRSNQADLQTATRTIEALEQAADNTRVTYDAEHLDRETTMNAMREQLAADKALIQSLQMESGRLKTDETTQTDALAAERARYAELEQILKEHQADYKSVFEQKTAQETAFLQERARLQESAAVIQAQYEDLQNRDIRSMGEYQVVESQLQKLRQDYAELQARHTELASGQTSDENVFQTEYAAWTAKNNALQAELAGSQNTIAGLQADLQQKQELIQSYEQSVASLMGRLGNLLSTEQIQQLMNDFQASPPSSYRGQMAVRSARKTSRVQYAMKLLQKVMDIIREAHRNDLTRRRKRGSSRR
jgi:chromosome segregation ATPase